MVGSGVLAAPAEAPVYRPPAFRLAAAGEAPPAAVPPGAHAWRTADARAIAYGFRHDGRYWMHWPSLATYGFAPDDAFITAHPHPGASLEKIVDIYGRSVLPMALQAFGFEALHASAVVDTRGIVLFAGRSKAGKSTIAFGLNRRGYAQWSDDGVVFNAVGGGFEAIPLAFAVRLRKPSWDLLGLTVEPAEVDRRNAPSEEWTRRIAAICLVSRSGELDASHRPELRRVAASAAFSEILMHAHEFDPSNRERRRRMLDTYLAVAGRIPVFEISFRSGRDHFDAALDCIADTLGLHVN